MSLRILGGEAKGRALKVPDSARPSGARVRKSLFDLLQSRRPPEGRTPPSFLDLHGGSGAVGFEAASRGYRTTLIEQDAAAFRALEHNARDVKLWRKVKLLRGDALKLLPKQEAADIVFSDPPYEQDIPATILAVLHTEKVAAGGMLIAQHDKRVTPPEVEGWALEVRRMGSNCLSIYTRAGEAQ